MTYVKTGLVALLASIVLGAVTGTWHALMLTVERLRPEDRQVVLSRSISEATNDTALCVLLIIPSSLIVAYVVRRRRQRRRGGRGRGVTGHRRQRHRHLWLPHERGRRGQCRLQYYAAEYGDGDRTHGQRGRHRPRQVPGDRELAACSGEHHPSRLRAGGDLWE